MSLCMPHHVCIKFSELKKPKVSTWFSISFYWNKCYKKQKNENLIISELWLRKENDEHVNVAIIPDVFGVKNNDSVVKVLIYWGIS